MAEFNYPAKLAIDYPDRNLNRLTTFFRMFTVIPILIILCLIAGASTDWHNSGWQSQPQSQYAVAGGLVVLPLVLMILFRRKYPRWWFDWNLALTRFSYRVWTYLSLLTDVYPSTDEEQAVHIDISYPDTSELNRWLPLVKWILAIPHYIVLFFLWIAAEVIVIIAWFAILFTGRYPRDMFNFVVDVSRWYLRVMAYAALLVTDKYPPFSLSA
jgi:FtsH-binding integral membrane protein